MFPNDVIFCFNRVQVQCWFTPDELLLPLHYYSKWFVFFLLEQGLHQVTILLTFMHSRAAFLVQLQHSTHFYNYHTSNSHECMGVNGEALQLHAVYKREKKNFFFTTSHARIRISTTCPVRIRIRYYKSRACICTCNEIEGSYDKIIITIESRKNITGSFLPAKILIRETIFTSYW